MITKSEFKKYEALIYSTMVGNGAIAQRWSYPLIDNETNLIYLCETPEPLRLIKLSELAPIFSEISDFAQGLITLQDLKYVALNSSIPENYKELINSMSIENRNDYFVDEEFNDFLRTTE